MCLCLLGCTWAACLTKIKFDNGLVHTFLSELMRICVCSGQCKALSLSSIMHIQVRGFSKALSAPLRYCRPTCLPQTLVSTRLETWKIAVSCLEMQIKHLSCQLHLDEGGFWWGHNPDSRFSRNGFKSEEQNERQLTLLADANRSPLSVIPLMENP